MHRKSKKVPPHVTHYTRGVALYREGRLEEATLELARLRDRTDMLGRMARYHEGLAHRQIGLAALRRGDYATAESRLGAAVSAVGPNADLSKYLAAVYVRTGQYARSADQLERARDCRGEDVDTWRRLAQTQWRSGRREQAYLTLAEALRKIGSDAKLHLQLGLFHAAEEQYDQAREALERAAEADGTCSQTHYHLGLTAAAAGDVPAAFRSFQRAFQLRPDDLTLAYQLALTARAAEQAGRPMAISLPESSSAAPQCETRCLAEYIVHEPDFIKSCLALPATEADAELFGMLADVVRAALDDHPGYADLHVCASRIHDRLGQTAPAVTHAARAIEINPHYLEALVHLAGLEARLERHPRAIELLERAIACGADWPDIHCRTGELMIHCNATEGARKHLRRALQLNANYTRAADALAALAA